MHRRHALLGGFLLFATALAVSVAGQPGFRRRVVYEVTAPAKTPPQGNVSDLVTRLSSPSLSVRREARFALQSMGEDIRPQLQWALDEAKAQVPDVDRLRNGTIATVHPEIAELAVVLSHSSDAARARPSTVTLRHTNAPVMEVLRDFASQLDLATSISSRPRETLSPWFDEARVSVGLDGSSYWRALDTMQRSMGLRSTFGGAGVEFYRGAARESGASASVESGPLWIAALPATRDPSGTVTVLLDVAAEPKVMAGSYVQVNVQRYVDDRGRSLAAGNSAITTSFVDSPDRLTPSRVALKLPAPATGRSIGVLGGRVGVSIGPGGHDLAVADLSQSLPQSFEWDDVVMTVSAVTQAGPRFVVTGEFLMPVDGPRTQAFRDSRTASGLARERGETGLNRLGLLNASRQGIRRTSEMAVLRHNGDRDIIEWTLTTSDPAQATPVQRLATDICMSTCAPRMLTWSLPPDTRWFSVPFELRNIPVGVR